MSSSARRYDSSMLALHSEVGANDVTYSSILGVGRRGRGTSRSRLTILGAAVGLQLCISMNMPLSSRIWCHFHSRGRGDPSRSKSVWEHTGRQRILTVGGGGGGAAASSARRWQNAYQHIVPSVNCSEMLTAGGRGLPYSPIRIQCTVQYWTRGLQWEAGAAEQHHRRRDA